MNILTDGHVPRAIPITLQSEDIDAITIYDADLIGGDQPLLEYAIEHGYVVLTDDPDFVTKDFVTAHDHHGIFFYEDQRHTRTDLVRPIHNAVSVLRPDNLRNEIVFCP
ncbi:DUF5615 family PIN-like protein [Halocatena pleomorpha]|uniref:DUF5615 domain-containing protein n=1 Tax=Halocatena pleomorpha TaxID=1785090 RepID=A0A3P3R8D4_9EURY|nr:DUF5615 family PIN-like protein [Halocatena pleomorpha]RRJ28803.1 hypothetical protein EIK79_14880 [Halocatena pleomorpha]